MSNYSDVKKKLDTVSSCFCLAKWTTVTLHLESGTNHSCHHPKVHDTPVEELVGNPAALHNTKFKIQQRKGMIEGNRPEECGYCWNVEDLKSESAISDRIIKSSAPYSMADYEKIKLNPYDNKLVPRYVEASFSNTCQFKCSYCSANFSSSWAEELEKHGQYHNRHGENYMKIYKEDENPYIKAFWEWWPDLKRDLDTFRITGGEPLLSPNTFKVLESLLVNPEPNLSLNINSNLGAPEVLVNKFINLIGQLSATKSVRELIIYTSIDAFGARAEYIRHGLKHDQFWNNVDRLLSADERTQVIIMCTFNALSITTYVELLQKICEVNEKHKNANRPVPLEIDIAYLRHPFHQTVNILTDDYIPQMESIVKFIEANQMHQSPKGVGFHNLHTIKATRILEWMKKGDSPASKRRNQADFYKFFTEHDRRRNKNFLETFPEMDKFWNYCKQMAETV
ncbi:MAG: hypothetical protein K0R29_1271 [Pseudobdellovibrio sp.]|nr:hypothetical protein [Pseudobdellovibrio sp.]